MTRVIQVFARAPVPGRSKTRLVPALGEPGAAALHGRLVLRVLDTLFAAQPRLRNPRVELWCAPDTTHPFFQLCIRRYPLYLRAQVGEDLGSRMQFALEDAVERQERPVLVGTDSPSITADALMAAFAAIDAAPASGSRDAAAADIVLLPTEDGGYALIGASRCDSSLFDAMQWSTGSVYAESCRRIERLGWRRHALPLGWDVDRPEDLDRLRAAAPELFDALEVR